MSFSCVYIHMDNQILYTQTQTHSHTQVDRITFIGMILRDEGLDVENPTSRGRKKKASKLRCKRNMFVTFTGTGHCR